MKMETVQELLAQWGEIIIHTAGGQTFELHLGDTEFDKVQRLIRLKAPDAHYIIDGDAVESVTQHYGHRED